MLTDEERARLRELEALLEDRTLEKRAEAIAEYKVLKDEEDKELLAKFLAQAADSLERTGLADYKRLASTLRTENPGVGAIASAHGSAIPLYDQAQAAAENAGVYKEAQAAAESESDPARSFSFTHAMTVRGRLSPMGQMTKDLFACIHYGAFIRFLQSKDLFRTS